MVTKGLKGLLGRLYSTIFADMYIYHLKKDLLNCASVLDLGCGRNSPLREVPIPYSVGVESFRPYLEESKGRKIHTEYILGDVRQIEFKEHSFDAVLALDLIEHLTKEEGIQLIKKMQKWARKKVIIFTPNGYLEQNGYDNNPLQIHQSDWSIQEFKQLDFRVYGVNGLKYLRGYRAKLKFKPRRFWQIISDMTQKLSWFLPKYSFQLLCVKKLFPEKIAYIVNARMPTEKAHGYQILKMCESFSGTGVKIDLILPFRVEFQKRMKQIKNIWKYYEIKRKFRMKKLLSLDLIWVTTYTKKVSTPCFYIQAISFAIFAAFYSLFKKTEVYYTRDCFFAFFFSSLKSLHKRKIYYEGHKFEPLVSRLMKREKLNGLIVITNKLKELYVREGIPEGKILVAPDGVDLKMFDNPSPKEKARNGLGIPLDKKVICYTGHLYDWKGAHVLARSMKNLSDNCVSYFIGGTEGDISKFKEFIGKNEISNVILIGYVPPSIVPKYLAASDVVILPNIRKYLSKYTSPLKLFEYMASKKPIVSSDLPSIREILNEENAILVEPGNPEALAEGIKKVLENKKLANKIAENAYKDVQQYTWDKRAEEILKFMVGKG